MHLPTSWLMRTRWSAFHAPPSMEVSMLKVDQSMYDLLSARSKISLPKHQRGCNKNDHDTISFQI